VELLKRFEGVRLGGARRNSEVRGDEREGRLTRRRKNVGEV